MAPRATGPVLSSVQRRREDDAEHTCDNEVDDLNPAVLAKRQHADWVAPQIEAVPRQGLQATVATKSGPATRLPLAGSGDIGGPSGLMVVMIKMFLSIGGFASASTAGTCSRHGVRKFWREISAERVEIVEGGTTRG